MGYHVVSINRTLPISNKTHIKVVHHSLILYSPFTSSLLALFYNNINFTFNSAWIF